MDENNFLQKYKENLMLNAKELVTKTFEDRLSTLEEILQRDFLKIENSSSVNCEIVMPVENSRKVTSTNKTQMKRKLDHLSPATIELESKKSVCQQYDSVACNKHIIDIIDLVKPIIQQFSEDTKVLEMWVKLLIPKIEDGDNFGVSIQEKILNEISEDESAVYGYFDEILDYYLTRGDMVAKILKNPNVADYKKAVLEHDEKQFYHVRFVLREMMNHYATLKDVITKNLEKITKPRSSHLNTMF